MVWSSTQHIYHFLLSNWIYGELIIWVGSLIMDAIAYWSGENGISNVRQDRTRTDDPQWNLVHSTPHQYSLLSFTKFIQNENFDDFFF